MRPLPPGYNPKGNPRPRPRPRPGIIPLNIPPEIGPEFGPRPGINPLNIPPEIGPEFGPRPGIQQPIPRDYGYGNQLPGGINPRDLLGTQQPIRNISNMGPINVSPFNSTPGGVRGGMGPDMQMQQAPLQQQFSYGGRAGYQMGGGIMGLENGQEEPIFPRLEILSQNLGQAEQTLGTPSNDQFNSSSITTAITGRPQMNRGGITSLNKARQVLQKKAPRGEFLAYINPREAQILKAYGGAGVDINGTGIPSYFIDSIVGGIGDILGGAGDVLGDVVGSVGDVVGDVVGSDIFQKALPLAIAYFTGNPAAATASEGSSFLPSFLQAGGTEGGLGSFSNILGNIGSFMPQGETSGFNPYQFASNLILNQTQQGDKTGGENLPTDMVSILTNILNKLLTKEGIAGSAATTVAGLTFDEIKRLNEQMKKEFEEYKQGKARKRTQYRTAKGREALPGYEVTGVPQTTADVFRAPAMRGGIMNVPTGQPRRNSVGVKELDYRQSGGFVPPIGVKEKADDIPAMLSNNEFVFTADAVRAAGGGSVNKGAQKMYSLMKQLEGKV